MTRSSLRIFAVLLAAFLGLPELCVAPASVHAAGRSPAAPPAATDDEESGGVSEAAVDRLWKTLRQLLREGDYAQALQRVETLERLTPQDERLRLYRDLCEARLASTRPFTQLSRPKYEQLAEALKQEEQQRHRNVSAQKAAQQQVEAEQLRWDRELEALQQAAELQAKRRRATEKPALAPVDEKPRKAPAEAPAVAAEVGRPPVESDVVAIETLQPEEPLPAATEAPAVPGVEEGVELSPVTVTTKIAPAPETPSLKGRPRPPAGGAQINARQMSVSPDKKIAIAEGDVEVIYGEAYLTCDQLTLFTDTKDAYAEGHVRLEDGPQVFRGEMMHYNFETKKGRFLEGTVSSAPWHEHGRSMESIAEGVYRVTPGYITSCELEPPHFKFAGRKAIVFADDKLARVRNAAFVVDKLPFLYLPYVAFADRQMPFYILPGKKKPWEQFVLMGYRYELAEVPGNHKGTVKADWRRTFGWGFGTDHQFDSPALGKGLLKLYYNEEPDSRTRDPKTSLPKGAALQRYRALWRHRWQPDPKTTVITDLQKYSDANFRKDFLFREEFVNDDQSDSFISAVRSDPDYTLSGVARKRLNRFQTSNDALPQLTLDVRQQQVGDTWLFSESKLDFANLQSKTRHSDADEDVVRLDWFQQLRYALNWLRPLELTPRVGVRQTYYTKDIQGGSTRPQGKRDFLSGQFNTGMDASLKLFRIFNVATQALGLNINGLRHVLTPTVGYNYFHQPTVPNSLLNFAAANSPSNAITLGVENKLQTRRPDPATKKLRSVDLLRAVLSLPYTFHGQGNEQGGRWGDWSFDTEVYPWPWMRLESDWVVPSHFVAGTRDDRIQQWNLDLVLVGGRADAEARYAPEIQAPTYSELAPGAQGGLEMMPQGQWYVGMGHRYHQNDKTETVLQYDWRLSSKWQIGTFHRLTWKEVAEGSKRLTNMREYQYSLRRDLHDWIGEVVYRVDREFGEELFLTLTLKAYPNLPIETSTSYHQPKIGSQSSPFSPVTS